MLYPDESDARGSFNCQYTTQCNVPFHVTTFLGKGYGMTVLTRSLCSLGIGCRRQYSNRIWLTRVTGIRSPADTWECDLLGSCLLEYYVSLSVVRIETPFEGSRLTWV